MTTRRKLLRRSLLLCAAASITNPRHTFAQPSAWQVIDIPTRPGVTQRFLYFAPVRATAAVVLYAGGHGGLGISSEGRPSWGGGNFLVRSRHLFARNGLAVAVVDAPSDRKDLEGFRQRDDHVADAKALIAWLRERTRLPVWLIGTSRGTQSVAYIATQAPVADGGPDGIVLSASILIDRRGRPVPLMALERIGVPVLVVHHEDDGCHACPHRELPWLMRKLEHVPRRELMSFRGGISEGDPCEARAHHGFNGIEDEIVARIAGWITR